MRLGSIAAAAGALLALAAPARAAQQVLYVGDSLGVGTTPGFARELGASARVHGDSRIGRPSPEGLSVLRQRFSPSDDVIVFDLGTNDDPAQPGRLAADLASARALTGDRCMIVATLNRPPLNGVPVDGLNSAVLAFADQAKDVQLVDWNAIAASEPNLLGPDHIHPTPDGYAVRAQLLAEAVAQCGAAPPAEPPVATTNPPKPTRPKARAQRPIKVPGIESSGISFTEPVSVRGVEGELRLPNTKPPYPAVIMLNGGGPQAEFFAAHGIAALTLPFRNSVADARAAVAKLRSRKDIRRAGVGLWGYARGADVAALAAAGDPAVGAVIAVSPTALPRADVREWSIRRALDVSAPPVATWLGLRARSDPKLRADSALAWAQVRQPVLAIWGTRDGRLPIRASAAALRDALAAGPNRDRSFRWFAASGAGTTTTRRGQPVFAPGYLQESARWLGTRLGARKAQPAVSTPLPPANGPEPAHVASGSTGTAPAIQLIWLLLPALMLGWAAVRMRSRLVVGTAIVDLAALACIAAGVADVLSSDGRDVTKIAGIPWLFALAFVLAATGLVLTIRLARARLWLPVAGSAIWLALALFWLL